MVPGKNTNRWIWALVPVVALGLAGVGLAVAPPRFPDGPGRSGNALSPGQAETPSELACPLPALEIKPPVNDGPPARVLPSPILPAASQQVSPSTGKEPTLSVPPALILPGMLDKAPRPSSNGGPEVLNRPIDTPPPTLPDFTVDPYGPAPPFQAPQDAPPGFTGPSSVSPAVLQNDGHFVPVEDRWRVHFPYWDRYGTGHAAQDDYPFEIGRLIDPYHQNVLKGDYPIFGQNTFFEFTAINFNLFEARQVPTPTTPFESTARPFQAEFFGRPSQNFFIEQVTLAFELIHGDGAFKQPDWRIRIAPTFNNNNLVLNELGIVNPNVQKGVSRLRTFSSFNEYWVEKKIADLSPNFDFVSLRIGSQPFVSDFRGFIFFDLNLAARLFGTLNSNREQFNIVFFDNQEKDSNSQLDTLRLNRYQRILIANFFEQDFIWPGYTALLNFHYNHDSPAVKFDKNSFLVRPDAAGIFQPHGLDVAYLGWGGDGHINRFNITHQVYWALGHDSNNPIGNGPQNINAWMAAVELSYDRDYLRFRTSYFFASGDGNPNNRQATGFDTIIDNPNFAGTQFSYWERQQIGLFGVNLKQRLSLVPNLRSSKIQGQSNFVNPGLHLFNLGWDADLTPKLKLINNYNLLWFDKTASLQQFVFQGNIDRFIGGDLSSGLEYRPMLSNNVVMLFGLSTLIPGDGFKDLFNRFRHDVNPLVAAFAQVTLAF